jgi:hypothetical protein
MQRKFTTMADVLNLGSAQSNNQAPQNQNDDLFGPFGDGFIGFLRFSSMILMMLVIFMMVLITAMSF